ncbi:MAG TPA: DUF1236 domain-containing protein [Bauldia sp.]|nr:DUF1236 domain-containing protein [Bauldia sp.]
MNKKFVPVAAAIALLAAPVAANAAGGTTTGAAGGAITGAIVGGPVGAAVGGVIGAIVGTAIEPPPPQVVAWVQTQQEPAPVMLQGNLAIGATLPDTVVLYPVPQDVYVGATQHAYAYAVVNNQRVVVDPQTHVVVAIVG